ncbi:cytochrome c [Bradyrhizobium neotropicale]|uniref:c-type cytochrome n=1 Tax=Bradyrhizobium neotropicale TaxID=1497615 RepID=UPI001AD6DBCF|nr:cytochrome c [Bradyrhizobium neotropicale]MBO4220938.1 c-type cytochrome [Bradyrhizobium neotropicale]
MRARTWFSAGIATAVVLAVGAWLITAPQRFASADLARFQDKTGDAVRGKMVFAAGDCASCHASPGQADRLHLGGGLALASPYGTFRVPNISMDPVDGIGNWQTKDLANALLNGVSPSGTHYYPVFPYASLTHMHPQDVADLMAYLRTLPAVKGRPPPHELVSLFSVRRFIGFWKILYFRPGPLAPDPARDEKWNRGRYLVEALAHCAECHSSRDMFGGIKAKTRYAGGQDPEGAGYYPNITPEGLDQWPEQDLIEMLRTGKTPGHGRVGSSMADVVTNTAMLPENDREAIAFYIKSLPARPTPTP